MRVSSVGCGKDFTVFMTEAGQYVLYSLDGIDLFYNFHPMQCVYLHSPTRRLLSCGSNYDGVLGLGTDDDDGNGML